VNDGDDDADDDDDDDYDRVRNMFTGDNSATSTPVRVHQPL